MKALTTALLIALSAALLACLALPVHAGGPVITEDATEAAPLVRSHNNRLVPILLGLAVAAIILGGGSDACNGDETPEPTPEPTGC